MTPAGCGRMTGYAVCATGLVDACRAAAAGAATAGPGRSDRRARWRTGAPERDVNDQLPERRQVACGAGSQGFHARSCCSRSARSAAMARAVWLFTAPQLMPIAAATSASQKSA